MNAKKKSAQQNSLFQTQNTHSVPLAERLRPKTLDEVMGQEHLTGQGGVLARMVQAQKLQSIILWGPPGCGKTTIARLLADAAGYELQQVSAVASGIADLKAHFDAARERALMGNRTALFVDEIHRFNRAQQDVLLPVVEDGTVTLIGATTENPSFELNSAVLSRARVLVLNRLSTVALEKLLQRAEKALAPNEGEGWVRGHLAVSAESPSPQPSPSVRERGYLLPLTPDAREALIAMADGDGRYLLTMLEFIWDAVGATSALIPPPIGGRLGGGLACAEADSKTLALEQVAPPPQPSPYGGGSALVAPASPHALDVAALAQLLQQRPPVYDKAQESHYNLISALHKSLRGSDVDAALYWFARILAGGEDPRYITRRLVRFAVEDIGMADPQAHLQAIAAAETYERLGSPEGELAIAQAVIYLATAPKSNAQYVAFKAAQKAAAQHGSLMPPKHILNAPTKMMKELGYGAGYAYDHDAEDGFSGQNYFPDGMARQQFYQPVERGFERDIAKRLEYWTKLRAKRG